MPFAPFLINSSRFFEKREATKEESNIVRLEIGSCTKVRVSQNIPPGSSTNYHVSMERSFFIVRETNLERDPTIVFSTVVNLER